MSTVKSTKFLFSLTETERKFLYKKVGELQSNSHFKGNKSIAVLIRSFINAEMERNTKISDVGDEQELVNRLVSAA